jgi:hypothetical protein
MVDILRIKRRLAGGAAGPPSSLANSEIAFNEQDRTLYYGLGNNAGQATSIIAIGGDAKVDEAPLDGQAYERKSGAWAVASGGGASSAASVTFTPAGNVAATNVQAAIAEVDSEKVAKAGDTMTGDLQITKSFPLLTLNKTVVTDSNRFESKNNGVLRWRMNFGNGTPESGSNAGSDFGINCYADDGSAIGTPLLFTRSSMLATFNGNLTVSKVSPAISLGMTAASQAAGIVSYQGANKRWEVFLGNGNPESGSNVGSDFAINRYDDAGALLPAGTNTLRIDRATGNATFSGLLTAAAVPTAGGHLTNKTYVDGAITTGDNLRVLKAGDTMSGILTVSVNVANWSGIFYNANTGGSGLYGRSANDANMGLAVLNAAGNSWSHQFYGNGSAVHTGAASAASFTAPTIRGTNQLWTHGWAGDNNNSIIFFRSDQGQYLNATPGAIHFQGGYMSTSVQGRLWGVNDGTPYWNTGGTISGNIYATGSIESGAHMRAGNCYWYSGWGGHYFSYDGTTFNVPWGNFQVGGAVIAGAWLGGSAEANNGARVRISSGNYISWFWDGNLKMYVDGGHVKNFVIDHPTDPDRWLIHGCLEGPEAGVYYRGESELTGTSMEVELPAYFTALVDETTASVQVTPILTVIGKDIDASSLAVSRVRNGRFTVARTGSGAPSKHTQPFYWRVEATRKDVKPLNVEPLKSTVNVYGDGPYRYYEER